MKKVFSFLSLSACMIMTVQSQKPFVPDTVKRAFIARFPDARDVKWEKENSRELEANFKLNNTSVSANFTLDGSWKETETTIAPGELPAAVSQAVTKKYPGATMEHCERIEKPGNRIFYEVNIRHKATKKELELDEKGQFID